MRDNEFTKILGWPGYRVYRHQIDEAAKTLRLWVRRKRGNRKLICSGCGRKFSEAHDCNEREVRDLPWGEYRTTVIIEVYRVCCPNCGIRGARCSGSALFARGLVSCRFASVSHLWAFVKSWSMSAMPYCSEAIASGRSSYVA